MRQNRIGVLFVVMLLIIARSNIKVNYSLSTIVKYQTIALQFL